MQQTSAAYKTEQKNPLREASYVWVYLGIIDRTAQRTARLDSSVTEWSKVPTGNDLLEGIYATYEENFFRADGSMQFPPESAWAMYQGAASASIGGAIKFAFDSPCDIRGISLKFFDDAIPLTFTISNGTVTYSYTYDEDDVDKDDGKWSCEDEFVNSSYILITPLTLKGGNQRMRLQQILFGKGFYFSNKDLLSTSYTSTVSHLSDKLPSKTFSFTIDNTNKKFAADDPHSFVHFLQKQQEIDFDYGRDLPGGGIEKIKGGKMYLKTWATDDLKATFNAVGYLEFMDTTYYKGYIYPDTTFYNRLDRLAQNVLTDAGITQYNLDSCLHNIVVHNPLPVEKHKNLLQLIANAARCIFYEDRDGILTIAPAYEGTVENVTDYTLEYRDLLSSPNAATTEFIKNVVCQYYTYAISPYFSEVGSVEAEDVNIGENFIIFSKPMDIYGAFYEGTSTEETIFTYRFGDMPGQATLDIAVSNNGIAVHSWQSDEEEDAPFGKWSDFTITLYSENNVLKEETGVDSAQLHYQCPYPYDPEETEYMFDVWCRIRANTLTEVPTTGNGAYYIKFNANRRSKIIFWGHEVNVITSEVSDDIRAIGVDKTCKNVLISDSTWANANLAWMKDYYDDDIEYTVDYRGEPALDCDDVIYLDNQYVSKNYVRVTESTINTSQGMDKGTLKLRRSSWKDFGRVDFAIVDGNEVK